MTRTFESRLTAKDREWLLNIDRAMRAPELPQHVVSVDRYCALVDSAAAITRENYRLRQYRRRMASVGRRQQQAIREWRWGAIVAMVCLGMMCALWIRRGL